MRSSAGCSTLLRRSFTFSNCIRPLPNVAIPTRDGSRRSLTRSRMKSKSSAIGRSARNSTARALRICVRSLPRSSTSTATVRFVACELDSTATMCDVVSSAPALKTTSLSPRPMRSPGRSGCGSTTRRPFSSVPLTLPQSRSSQPSSSSCTISAWRRERKRSLIGTVQSFARPSVITPPGSARLCGARPGWKTVRRT